MRDIDMIVVHCSATPEGRDFTVKDIDRWHKARGWKGIGYHYVVYRDGSVHEGRPVNEVGAHAKGYNAHSIGVCYIGGMTADGKKSKDTRTDAQKAALRTLLGQLKARYPKARIVGHRDLSPDKNHNGKVDPWERIKDCPSFDAIPEYADIK